MKKTFILFIIINCSLLINSSLNAQTIQELDSLQTAYTNAGNYDSALIYAHKSLQLIENNNGKLDTLYANKLMDISNLYYDLAEYETVIKYDLECKNIREIVLGKEHPDYAMSCNNLGLLYDDMGNYQKAEPLYIEAKTIREKVLGTEHPDYAISCNNLAELYKAMGNYQKAEPLYIEAINIQKNVVGKEHPDYAISGNNLANLYYVMGNYQKAEPLYIEAKNIFEKVLGTEHPSYANNCYNLARLYKTIGNYSKAELFYIEAKNIYEKVLGKEHPRYATNCNNLALLYQAIGNYQKAEPLIIEANQNIEKQVLQSGTFMSEAEREKFLENNITEYYNQFNSFYLKRKAKNPALTGISYNNALLMKGLLLRSGIAMRQAVLNSGDENLINTYNEWLGIGGVIVKLESMPIEKRFMDLDSLREVANNLEKSLFQNSDLFEKVGTLNTKWEDVQNSLQKNEVAIEFTHFQYHDDKRWTDSTYYCALILKKGMKQPEMVYLFEERELQAILKPEEYITSEEENVLDLYQTFKSETKSDSLYSLIWKPLEEHLAGIETINMSLTGLLLTIPFHALPVNNSDSILLMDKFKFNYLTTTANLVMNTEFFHKDIENAVLFGGIDYMADTTLWKQTALKYSELPARETSRGFQQNLEDFEYNERGGYEMWTYLKGTAKETELIHELMQEHKIATEYYTAINATEEVFKSLSSNSPAILHIATHGFYFPEVEKSYEKFKSMSDIPYIHSNNPLVRSGLIFAGANHTWNGKEIQGIEDGTLSAYEVSLLDLFDCRLVVLSACQTGLGAVAGSEGIYGLQRGFKMAGVDFMIYTLWSVDDYATQLFMTTFYTNLFSGMEVREAFAQAQLSLREKVSASDKTKEQEIQYWAPFVLVY